MAESDAANNEDIGSLEVRAESDSDIEPEETVSLETRSDSEELNESTSRRVVFMPSGITQLIHKHFPWGERKK